MRRLAFVAFFAACSSNTIVAPDAGPAPPQKTPLALDLVDQFATVVPGETTKIVVRVNPGTQSAPATFDVGPLSVGLSASTATWTYGDQLVTLVVTAAPDAPIARAPFELHARRDGTIVGTTTGTLSVSNVAGSLDPSFAVDGVMSVDIERPIGIARASGDTYVIAGFDVTKPAAVLTRILSTGTPDTTFGTNGRTWENPTGITGVLSMATASDGRIALGIDGAGVVLTFDATGQLLATISLGIAPRVIAWDGDGLFVGDINAVDYVDAAHDVATTSVPGIFPSSIVSLGSGVALIGRDDGSIAKYVFSSSTLTQDPSYDVTAPSVVLGLLRSNGLLYVASPTSIVRLTSTGALDPTYGTAGVASPNVPNLSGAMVLTPSNEIIDVGLTANTSDEYVTRFTPAGIVDATFGTYGDSLYQHGGLTRPVAIALDATGTRAYVVGHVDDGVASQGYVTRYRLAP